MTDKYILKDGRTIFAHPYQDDVEDGVLYLKTMASGNILFFANRSKTVIRDGCPVDETETFKLFVQEYTGNSALSMIVEAFYESHPEFRFIGKGRNELGVFLLGDMTRIALAASKGFFDKEGYTCSPNEWFALYFSNKL